MDSALVTMGGSSLDFVGVHFASKRVSRDANAKAFQMSGEPWYQCEAFSIASALGNREYFVVSSRNCSLSRHRTGGCLMGRSSSGELVPSDRLRHLVRRSDGMGDDMSL